MGQKVNPVSLRLRVNRQQDSSWFGDFHYGALFTRELVLRNSLDQIFQLANLSSGRIVIKCLPQKTKVFPLIGVSHFLKKRKKDRQKLQLSKAFLRKNLPCFQKTKSKKQKVSSKKSPAALNLLTRQFGLLKSPNSKITQKSNSKLSKTSIVSNFLKRYTKVLDKLPTREYSLKLSGLSASLAKTQKINKKVNLRSELQNYQRMVSKLIPQSQLNRKKFYSQYTLKAGFSSQPSFSLGCVFQLVFLLTTNESAFSKRKLIDQLLSKFYFYESLLPVFQRQLSQWTKTRRHFLLSQSIEHMESVFTDSLKTQVQLMPLKINNPYKGADFLAKKIAKELERTRAYRKVLKFSYQESQKNPFVKGIRISFSGRLGGAELADRQVKKLGPTSLQEFSEQIDYAASEAATKFGILGVKVWICYYKDAKKFVK